MGDRVHTEYDLSCYVTKSHYLPNNKLMFIFCNRLLLFIAVISLLGCANSAIKINIHGPVQNGGRAVAVAVDPANFNNVWVATPTGGLYESPDGGALWAKVDAMPEFGCFDVQFCPSDSRTMIVTCIEDTKAINGGGIWLSTDKGNTWSQPTGSRVFLPRKSRKSPFIPERYSAYGISFMPFTQNVFVGTDSGLAVSNDLGLNWHYINPLGNDQPVKIYSVLALQSGKVITSGENGIWMSGNGKNGWHQDLDGLVNDTRTKNSLAVLPGNDQVLFFTGQDDRQLLYSINGGLNWKDIDVTDFEKFPGTNGAGRRPYIKVIKAGFLANEFYLYYSYKAVVAMKKVKWVGSDLDFTIDSWHKLPMTHPDPSDIAFVSYKIPRLGQFTVPLYATNDGGVEKTNDYGGAWQQVGNVNNNFNALQVYDLICVRPQGGAGRDADIYFGTQDNGFYGSFNNGLTWDFFYYREGGNLLASPLKAREEDRSYNFKLLNISDGLYERCIPATNTFTPVNYPFVPNSDWKFNALYYAGVNRTAAIGLDNTQASQIYVSHNDGLSWTPTFKPQQDISLYCFISGNLNASPSVIAAFGPQAGIKNVGAGGGLVGLIRIDNALNQNTGDETPILIPLPNECVIGSYGNQWRTNIASLGVDPTDPGFIIIADIHNRMMYIRDNMGMWEKQQDLTDLITANGKYLFNLDNSRRGDFELSASQVSCISFDPLNHDRIAIGTAEAGVVISTNHGVTWKRVDGSERIGNVTSIAFGDGVAYVSSWGCGVWKIPIN